MPAHLMVPNISVEGWALPEAALEHHGIEKGNCRAEADWESTLAGERKFRVRGFSWFKRTFSNNISELSQYIPKVLEQIPTRTHWSQTSFLWDRFAARQIYDAAASKPLQFRRAAQILLLCETVARVKRPQESDNAVAELHQNMRIEPAIFSLTDFSRTVLEAAERAHEDIIGKLRRETGQETTAVFWEMAEGKTVSFRLAARTRKILLTVLPKSQVGDVIVVRKKGEPAPQEKVDGDSWGLPRAA